MIQANELRIGNWYLSYGVDYEQVEQITKGKVLIDFTPIPLTEDILLQCGAIEAKTINKSKEFAIGNGFVTFIWYNNKPNTIYMDVEGEELNIQL